MMASSRSCCAVRLDRASIRQRCRRCLPAAQMAGRASSIASTGQDAPKELQPAKQKRLLLLEYQLAPDYLQRRPAFRAQHLAAAEVAARDGKVLLGGALFEPADQALLVWHGATETEVADFVRSEPYVTEGLVRRWEIRNWMVVAGTAL